LSCGQPSRLDSRRPVVFHFSTSHFSGALTRDNCNHVGSSGDIIVGHFAINYHNEAAALGINIEELYAAQIADAEVDPPEWNIQGQQSNIYK